MYLLVLQCYQLVVQRQLVQLGDKIKVREDEKKE